MKRRTVLTMMAAMSAGLVSTSVAAADGARIGAVIGTPVPGPMPSPPVFSITPQIVVVPGSPVQYVANASFNLFVYSGRYYSLHNGAWFYAATPGGPWSVVAVDKVPRPVLTVPVTYYKVPPGHAKKIAGPPPAGGPGKGPKIKKGKED